MGNFIGTTFVDNSKNLWGREPVLYIYLVAMSLNLCGAYGLNWFSGKESLVLTIVGLVITFIIRGHVSPAQATSDSAAGDAAQVTLIQK